VEQFPDAAGEVALEAAERFFARLAFGLFACEVGGAVGVPLAFVDGEAVERAIELAVPAAVEAVAVGLTGRGGDRGGPARARELGVGAEAVGAGDLADQLCGGQRTAATLGEQLRRVAGDELGEL
jgi:hypothetical protein